MTYVLQGGPVFRVGQFFQDDSFGTRQAIPQSARISSAWLKEEACEFYQRLQNIPLDHNILLDLYELGFEKQFLPPGPFHRHFPKGSQVNKYESTAAFVYTMGTKFAYEMNRLLREHKLEELFQHYGTCVKGLWSYTEKMQDLYGQKQTLYRGIPGDWDQAVNEYSIGTSFMWPSFTSTSQDLQVSVAFATDLSKGQPILFEIETLSRGAPILSWSEYAFEGEILLQPYQGFHVTQLRREFVTWGSQRHEMLVISLQTIKLEGSAGSSIQPALSQPLILQFGEGEIQRTRDGPPEPVVGLLFIFFLFAFLMSAGGPRY